MRAKFMMITLIAAAMVSCRNETVETNSDTSIGFRTLLSRANPVDSAADVAEAGGFRVWGYRHTGNWPATYSTIFDGSLVTSVDYGETWSYGMPVRWPDNGDYVSFFAYAPANVAGSTIIAAQSVPAVGFVVNNNPAAQKDLLIAQPMLDQVGPDPVQMAFRHALSRISFEARKTPATLATLVITKIELKNLYYQGSTSLVTPVEWTVDDTETVVYELSGTLLENTEVQASDTSWQILPTTAGIMFLMPQTIPANAEIVVSFTYTDSYGIKPMVSAKPLSAYFAAWESGKPYTYRLEFDGDLVVIIGSTLEPTQNGTWGEY